MQREHLGRTQSLAILGGAAVMLSLAMGMRQSLGLFQPHMIRDIGQRTSTNFLGLRSSESVQYSYRLMYFRVDPAGTIVEIANGFWLGESERCVGYVGNIFQTCENPQALAADVAFFDSLVRTADGRPVTMAWLKTP